jgi:hypothetical protein
MPWFEQLKHATPLAPQAWSDRPSSHDTPMQQPSQLAWLHGAAMQACPMHTLPCNEQSWQACPEVPQMSLPVPAWQTPPRQHPSAQVETSQPASAPALLLELELAPVAPPPELAAPVPAPAEPLVEPPAPPSGDSPPAPGVPPPAPPVTPLPEASSSEAPGVRAVAHAAGQKTSRPQPGDHRMKRSVSDLRAGERAITVALGFVPRRGASPHGSREQRLAIAPARGQLFTDLRAHLATQGDAARARQRGRGEQRACAGRSDPGAREDQEL